MKTILHLILYTIAALILLAACESEEVKGLRPMADKLRVTETNIALTKEAVQRTLTVESNCDWSFNVEKSDNWNDLTVQKNTTGLTLQTEANITRSNRQATITISTSSGITRTIALTQTQGDVQLETQGGDNKTLTYLFSGGTQKFTVTSNTSWEIKGKVDEWFTLDKENGTGTDEVEVTVSEIQTDVARNATLVISAENGAKTDYIIIQQQGKVVELSVSPQTLTFAATGETKEIVIICNADWTASAGNDWITLSDYSGSQNKVIQVTLPANTSTTPLPSTVTIAAGSNHRETISINQARATPPVVGTLILVPNSIGRHEATLSFSISSDFPVTACGLCYSETHTEPTLTTGSVQLADGDMSDTTQMVTLSGLEAGVTYHVRAYATSIIGTTYSIPTDVTTSGSEPSEDDNPMPNPR